jgi:hypothetical protein
MSADRKDARRARRREFRPSLDERLEPRVVLSHAAPGAAYLRHPQLGFAYKHGNPPFLSQHAPSFPQSFSRTPHGAIFTAHGGQIVDILENGGGFELELTQFIATPSSGTTSTTTLEPTTTGGTTSATSTSPVQVAGTIRAYPIGGGSIGVIVDGTNSMTELDINPLPFPQRKGYAHSFSYGFAGRQRVINIGALNVTSGVIGAILGYHTANLSGPLTVNGNSPIDRIAFNSLLPGASITTGGDVNTLDVLYDANLSGSGTGISVGRDLNFMNIGGSMTLSNGANFFVARDLGQVAQPPKGTEVGLSTAASTLTNDLFAGALIQGNLTVNPGSTFVIGRRIYPGQVVSSTGSVNQPALFTLRGNLVGANRVTIPGAIFSGANQNIFIGGSITTN